MNRRTRCILFLFVTLAWLAQAATLPVQTSDKPKALAFDALSKTEKGDGKVEEIHFKFAVTNTLDKPFRIDRISTSCGCTAAKMKETPWVMEPGEVGSIEATMNVRGKYGRVVKTLMVHTEDGPVTLIVQSELPAFQPNRAPEMMKRSDNIAKALQDRQSVFKGDCVSCHVKPGENQMGKSLYDASCGICHEATHRAAMVPALVSLPKATNAEYWEKWIRYGRDGTLMPAFDKEYGGPLTEEQIDSLVEHLKTTFPNRYPTKAVELPVKPQALK